MQRRRCRDARKIDRAREIPPDLVTGEQRPLARVDHRAGGALDPGPQRLRIERRRRQQTAAAVWPFVQLMLEDYDTGDAAGFTIAFTNAGVGPAKMQDVRLSVDGKVIRNWSELVASVGGDAGAAVNRSFIADRVLRPDEKVVVFSTTDADLARKLVGAVIKPRGALTFCYCSIFDECWLADSRKDLQSPEMVEACPDFGYETYFN